MNSAEKTGNRKCWHVVTYDGKVIESRLTCNGAMLSALNHRASTGVNATYCRDGYKMQRCTGDAHRPEVGGNIDNCMVCAPRWGWVMVPEATCERMGCVSPATVDGKCDFHRTLTHVEKTLLGALK